MPLSALERSAIVAALGPTNTGKTHRAVERMLEHETGMIGLPLRLLAREVYDRISTRIGESRVALMTGEEKRIPPRPAYWVCTTEAMPVDQEVDFVAIDEIQLATHHQRGHVFTDRLLHARGRRETWFMGSDTMRAMVEQLVPAARIESHPRFSSLTHAGSLTLSALPPRTAVVGFTAPQVYEVAERLRRRRGGAAVVLGALSPRTRNAQVALYQSGEVQYLVATDAIGMGLNMDVDLVAFAAVRKFDGRDYRALEPAELAQIAGRAGRHLRNGRFATLAPMPPLADDVVFALETHRFQPVNRVFWRNADLDQSSVDALIASLQVRPPRGMLRKVEQAEDLAALLHLAAMPEVRSRAQGAEAVALLWEVCQIPDYRQLLSESHARLLAELYLQLAGTGHVLDARWMAERIDRLDSTDGDIETLMTRIAFIRTWTYVANRSSWIRDARTWQERTSRIEDRLSDALHERLMQRFVSPGRGGRKVSAPRAGRPPSTRTSTSHDVPAPSDSPFRALAGLKLQLGGRRAVAEPAQGDPLDDWVQRIVDASHGAFGVDGAGKIYFEHEPLARMVAGVDILRPDVALLLDTDLGPGARSRVQRRLVAFTRDFVGELLAPLRRNEAGEMTPAARGLVYQLELGLGTVLVESALEQLRLLAPHDFELLRRLDVRMGRKVVYVRSLLSEEAILRRGALVAVHRGSNLLGRKPAGAIPSFAVEPETEPAALASMGYPVFGGRAIRADVVERVFAVVSAEASRGATEVPPRVLEWLGCGPTEVRPVLISLGFSLGPDGWTTLRSSSRRRRGGRANQSNNGDGASR